MSAAALTGESGARSPWDRERFVAGMSAGDPAALDWLRARTEQRAAPRFSRWAWEWMRDDFFSELSMQLLVTMRKPGFELRTAVEAYVDVCIENHCRAWFRRIARVRAGESIDTLAPEATPRAPGLLETVAIALDMRRAMLELDAACRTLLLGKYVHGLSLQELGETQEVPAPTIQSRLHVCREKLRAIFRRLERSPTRTDWQTGALHDMNTQDES